MSLGWWSEGNDYILDCLNYLILFYLIFPIFHSEQFYDWVLRMQFVYVYVAPWKWQWGSVTHIIIQPLGIPHSAFSLLIIAASALFAAPLIPFLGSVMFLISYARPIKFWEKEYSTTRADNTTMSLSSQLADDKGYYCFLI